MQNIKLKMIKIQKKKKKKKKKKSAFYDQFEIHNREATEIWVKIQKKNLFMCA